MTSLMTEQGSIELLSRSKIFDIGLNFSNDFIGTFFKRSKIHLLVEKQKFLISSIYNFSIL